METAFVVAREANVQPQRLFAMAIPLRLPVNAFSVIVRSQIRFVIQKMVYAR